jgi:hypothetical protein
MRQNPSAPIIVDASSGDTTSRIQIRESAFNGTLLANAGFTLYATNSETAIIYDTDFISSKPYPGIGLSTAGPVFFSYGSSSPAWNGSTFLTPVVIRQNYTHNRLDGTSFFIDASPSTETAQGGGITNLLTGGNPINRTSKISITLPSGTTADANTQDPFWNGRIVEYKRIDTSNTEVVVYLALERGGRSLTICPGESVRLQNLQGRYYVLSRLRPYQ